MPVREYKTVTLSSQDPVFHAAALFQLLHPALFLLLLPPSLSAGILVFQLKAADESMDKYRSKAATWANK